MKKSSLVILLLVSIFFGFITSKPIHSHAQSPVTEWLVEYAEDARMTFSEELEGRVEVRKKISSDVELWSVKEGIDAETLRRELQEDPNVLLIEANVERHLAAESSNDPYIVEQWWLPRVGAETIWSRVSEQKKDVTVAVIDSGIDTQHVDLQKRIQLGGQNFYNDNDNGNVRDETGHGTKVSGIIAAEYGNREGVSGIAGPFDVKILPLKVFGASQTTKTSYIIAAIDHAVKLKADVINLSLGGPVKSDIEERAIQRAIQAGITVVAAAGNKAEEDNRPFYPASYEHVISVGSTDQRNQHVKSSNYNENLTLVAPGTFIFTTTNEGDYGVGEGTSFSSPIVAGAAAIVKSLQPEKTPQEIKEILQATATRLAEPGTSLYFGSGLLSLERVHQMLPAQKIPVHSVELSAEAVTMDLAIGVNSPSVTDTTPEPKFALYATVHPVNATDQTVIWSSSDPSIAEVDQRGVVTAKKVGTVFVTARANGAAAIATVNVVRNGVGYEFTSDFDNQKVLATKVFTVIFTQPLSPLKDYSQDIVISRESDGGTRVLDFTAKVNPLNFRQLWIQPNTSWNEGSHYLTVTKNVQNTHLLTLHKESRMMFYSGYK
ncbi:hypothetical protein CSV61_08880 [Sporosarcina sp. P3]|uniref:S8 family peptidase n=1 Tax=Sporosarcina sp. P3 TaxID=2048245 RepID=UPI000C16C598|nr:S8 family peptidase [Sporosarcina sp. P3]PID21799.1 hypothetical protein CSV61_08880 [Sporosarcina sp. P3]